MKIKDAIGFRSHIIKGDLNRLIISDEPSSLCPMPISYDGRLYGGDCQFCLRLRGIYMGIDDIKAAITRTNPFCPCSCMSEKEATQLAKDLYDVWPK